ncbi:biotin transporter BioY [Alloscardovia criceti]|uniref:biotin transporter BioY n=1 Tax=Alloscardovia criceti TaxID=356828 RepID=UPI00039D75B2|nr:biotin transporter BioY [Alloscardovia criceti]
MAGKISIPGTEVGITMQTFVLMLAALNLTQTEGVSAISSYIALGAMGLPVFAGGMSTLALIGPSSGFIWGFIPAFMISRFLISRVPESTSLTLQAVAYFFALIAGNILFLYACGVSVQAVITHMSWWTLMNASFGFIPLDIVKAVVAVSFTLFTKIISMKFIR